MKTSYKPSKLPAIAAQVRKEHPTSSEIRNYQLDNSFLDEVRQWAKLPKEDVDGELSLFRFARCGCWQIMCQPILCTSHSLI